MSTVQASTKPLVLVTGGTGYIAGYAIEMLLEKGYNVRATVRNPADEAKNAHLLGLKAEGKPIELVKANLLDADDWAAAVKGCTYVLHMASPVLLGTTNDEENDLIRPAVQGTLNVLRAASKEGVKRVVQTSSLGAVAFSQSDFLGSDKKPLTEEMWADEKEATAYGKSKVMSEKAAWNFIKSDENVSKMELVTLLPGVVFGPQIGSSYVAESLVIPWSLLGGYWPAVGNLDIPVADVRDTAELHVLAMEAPEAAGQRYLVVNQVVNLQTMAWACWKIFFPLGYWWFSPIPAPNLAAILVSPFIPFLTTQRFLLGVRVGVDSSKAAALLGRPWRDATLSFGESMLNLIEHGHVSMTSWLKQALDDGQDVLASLRPKTASDEETKAAPTDDVAMGAESTQ